MGESKGAVDGRLRWWAPLVGDLERLSTDRRLMLFECVCWLVQDAVGPGHGTIVIHCGRCYVLVSVLARR